MNSNISIKPEPNDAPDEPPPLESKRLSGDNPESESRGTNFYDSMRELNFDGMLQTMGGLMNDMKTMKTKLGRVLRHPRKTVLPHSVMFNSRKSESRTALSPSIQFK